KDVSRWVKSAGRTAAISATRQQALRGQWQQFPRFLGELQPTMAQLGALADASKIGNKAFKDSKEEVAELNAAAVNAPSASKQTRQFFQSLDDRNRSF